jgi:hypothetical protein
VKNRLKVLLCKSDKNLDLDTLYRRTQLISDTNLTRAEQNILAGGGQLDSGVVSDAIAGFVNCSCNVLKHQSSLSQTRKATEKAIEKKPVKERAYRILSQSLQDILYEEFNRYKYWKMSTLQERLQQPVHWIRQNLKAIAQREETGPYQSKSGWLKFRNDLLI